MSPVRPSCRRVIGQRVRWAAVPIIGVLALAGCAPRTLDAAKLESSISGDLAKAGLTGAAVACPADREARLGDTFTCTVTLSGGGTLTYDVSQTTADGEVAWKLAPNQLVLGADVASELERKVAAESGSEVHVTCPPSVLTPGGKGDLDCSVDAGGDVVEVTVHLEGGKVLTWDIKAPAGS